MVPEAPLEQTRRRLVPTGDGWFVLNARDSRWYYAEGRVGILRLRGRSRVRAGRRQHHGSPARRADGDVSLGGRPGGLPRALRRGAADHRGRGAAPRAVGLRPLPTEREARDHRRRPGPVRRARGGCASAHGRARTGVATPSTRRRSATVRASSRRRATRKRRTPVSRNASRLASATAGSSRV